MVKLSIRSLVIVAVLSVSIGLVSLAPAISARPHQGRSANYKQTQKFQKNVLHLKINSSYNLSVSNNQFNGEPAEQVAQLNSILSTAKRVNAENLLKGTPKTDLEARGQNSLRNYYKVRFAQDVDMNAIVSQLEALQIVESAYAEAKPAPSPSASYTDLQTYRLPAPTGIDANYASTVPGATGNRVKIVDVEYSWNTNHEDLSKARNAVFPVNTPLDPFNDNNHGTAVLGEMVADNNGIGVTGIVPDASLNLVNTYSAEKGYDILSSLAVATVLTQPGDVIIIEQQTWGPTDALYDYVPVEFIPEVYDYIKFITDSGRIVVEAAGNGYQNLDDAVYYGSSFPLGKPDSGAIIVGAGKNCLGDPLLSRMSFSNYGSRVNLQGPGNCVATTGYGNLGSEGGANGYYTKSFNGTSSATPVVASAAAALGSAFETLNNVAPTPTQIRTLLTQTGTAQNFTDLSALVGNIGPMPDLKRALATLAPPTDTTAPTAVVLSGRLSNNKPKLTWTAAKDNVAIKEYRIYRNGVYKTISTALTYTDTSAARRTKYSYYVIAVDTSGNLSTVSNTVSVTTR